MIAKTELMNTLLNNNANATAEDAENLAKFLNTVVETSFKMSKAIDQALRFFLAEQAAIREISPNSVSDDDLRALFEKHRLAFSNAHLADFMGKIKAQAKLIVDEIDTAKKEKQS
jgi:plasmid maintenance system antidote protein VapI